jgi:RNA polymerase sigma-70 factor (ECF subfamily)
MEIQLTPQFFSDRKLFKQLFADYYSPLCLFADKYIKDMEVSKDLVQDVFVKLWEKKVEVKSRITVKSFLYVTVRNTSLNHLRKQSSHEERFSDYSELEMDAVLESEMLEEDVTYRLYKAMEELSPRSKEAVLLTVLEYSNQEIAERMNVSVNTVKTLKQRSYRRLREDVISLLFMIMLIF